MPHAVLVVILLLGASAADEVSPSRAADGEPSLAPSASPPQTTIAILHEPAMPIVGTASDPETLGRIFSQAGLDVELFSAEQLADEKLLDPRRIDLVVIPTGQSFPAPARATFLRYLRGGGDFLSLGGYAFSHLLTHADGVWSEESAWLQAKREEALSPERSLIGNGRFEASVEIPVGGVELDGRWRRDSDRAAVVEENAAEGHRCAHVSLPADGPLGSCTFYLDLPPERDQTYEIMARLKTEDVVGDGYAYMAVYQHAADGAIVEFRDFATRRGTHDWSEERYTFSPADRVARLRIQLGLYRAAGAAWFDDVRLAKITGLTAAPMNTASGRPEDGLVVRPEQIGVFDPSFPLNRVRGLRAAATQSLFPSSFRFDGPWAGWAATGLVGRDNARWIPLLEAVDRYGRNRGAAAALLLNYQGVYRGSSWAYFGIENHDVAADPQGPVAQALPRIARFLATETYLNRLTTDNRLYRQGEPVRITAKAVNQGTSAQQADIEFWLTESPLDRSRPARRIHRQEATIEPGAEVSVEYEFAAGKFASDLYQIDARLSLEGRLVDQMVSGFVVEAASVHQSAAESRFVDNYFTHGGRPVFLFGSDDYSHTYHSAFENPLTWAQDHRAARDIGLQVYENLQYAQRGPKLEESDWRSFRAMAQLTQKHNLVFMPGMLIGYNVAVDDDQLGAQSALCGQYAERLGDTPALHYYINGDYRLDLSASADAMAKLWTEWLAERYGTTERWAKAWGREIVQSLEEIPLPPLSSAAWSDVAAVDRARFEIWLTRRWNEAHVRAVRQHDQQHPIMSEYYQRPYGGLDLPLTIDGQDVSDIGYFDAPITDIDKLPLAIRFNDLRARGKGVTLGEYGVKTHPSWTVDNGATHYHIRRSEEEQKQLFLAVGHYALGLGAAKIQNWCLNDAQDRVFPWGMFYPQQRVPKDVAFVHRNQSVIWRMFSPRHAAPPLTLCLPDNLRLGNLQQLGIDVPYRATADLLAGHFDFNVINDHHLAELPAATRVLLYPSPFAIEDEVYQQLLQWVYAGGTLIVTGDISCDGDRQPTRRARLTELLGVEFVSERYPNVERHRGQDYVVSFHLPGLAATSLRPCVEVRPRGAELLGTTIGGMPVLTRRPLGRGTVYWLADPLELDAADESSAARQSLYAALLQASGIHPLGVTPAASWLHVMRQPTSQGHLHVVFNTREEAGEESVALETAAGEVTINTRNRWPGLVAVTNGRQVVAVSADGEASAGGEPLIGGQGLKAALSLDGKDLRQSEAILVGPFETGTLRLPPRAANWAALVGEFRGGEWTTLERITPLAANADFEIDADRATCLILLCRPRETPRWTGALSDALQRPEKIAGY